MFSLTKKSALIATGFGIFAIILFLNYSYNQADERLFFNALAIGFLMVYFWITEVIPIYLTALFPIIFAHPLGLLVVDGKVDTSILSKSYGNSMIFIFLGGFMLALALEKWEIHTQIAKGILRIVGKKKSQIILGFLLSSSLLSMWVSNTATALMILPMASAVIKRLSPEEYSNKFCIYLLLSVAYGCNIGGVATLVGSPPNLQMAATLSKLFDTDVNFISWMIIGFPTAILMIFLSFIYFKISLKSEANQLINSFSLKKDPWNKNQYKVMLIFAFFIVFWSFKDVFALFNLNYSDEMVAIAGTVLLFLMPTKNGLNILEWKDTNSLPWGILLLFGGGLALADILKKGGVIDWIANSFKSFNTLPYFVIILILVSIAIFATEIISNLALVTLLIPIIGVFAEQAGIGLLPLAFSVTLAASFAFMLPVGTPPNAIVFSSGHITINQMAKAGFVMNIVGVIVVSLMCYLFL